MISLTRDFCSQQIFEFNLSFFYFVLQNIIIDEKEPSVFVAGLLPFYSPICLPVNTVQPIEQPITKLVIILHKLTAYVYV